RRRVRDSRRLLGEIAHRIAPLGVPSRLIRGPQCRAGSWLGQPEPSDPHSARNRASGYAFSADPAQLEAAAIGLSKSEGGGEDRPFHMDVEAEIEAAARCIVKVEAAVPQMKVEPRRRGVVDRADQLPVAMGADAKAADIAIGGQAEPAGEVDMVASTNQRIDPAGRTIDT